MIRLPVGKHHLEWYYFFALWCLYGLLINTSNLEAYNLQQVGVEAIAQRGHFYLEGSKASILQNFGDAFIYQGHIYANKQPGQFMLGAVAYSILHFIFGMSYEQNWVLTSALVTFFCSSSMAALTSVLVFKMAQKINAPSASLSWPLSAALIQGLCTVTLAYSGIAHHDIIASCCLFAAFYFTYSISQSCFENNNKFYAIVTGLFLGYAVTSSLLVLFMAVATGCYFLLLRQWHLLPYVAAGGMTGIAPMLFYNFVNFNNPLMMPYFLENLPIVHFFWDYHNQAEKMYFYSHMLFLYAPVILICMIGIFCFPRRLGEFTLVTAAILLALCFHIFNMQTNGICMYGPRFLLPAMPFLSLLALGGGYIKSNILRKSFITAMGLSAIYSAMVNIAGALTGSMNCNLWNYQFPIYLNHILNGDLPSYPLLFWLIVPFVLSCSAAGFSLAQRCAENIK